MLHNLKGSPKLRPEINVGSEKLAFFSQYFAISWKQYTIDPRLLWNVTMNSWVSDQSMSILMNLSDLERRL